MKKLLPILLALLLLLCACGTAAEPEESPAPAAEATLEPAPAEAGEESPAPQEENEFELPVLGREEAAGEEGSAESALSETLVTLDGLDSYLRVTLPEGWTWAQAGGAEEGTVYGLWPEDDPDFKVELHYWPNKFGMCGTGVSFTDYPLPDGRKATLATEEIGEELSWILILPESPDAFTIQFFAERELYEAHRAELELLLGSIRQGVLAGLDVVAPELADG